MLRRVVLACLAALLLATADSGPALARTMTMEQMQKQLEALSRQVKSLSALVEEQNKIILEQNAKMKTHDSQLTEQGEKLSQQTENLAAIAPAAGEDKDAVRISMKPMPKIESADGQYSFQPFGRVHMDYTFFDDDDGRDHPNSVDFRRARMGFKGDLGEDFSYKFEMDFAREGVAFKDISLTYDGLGFGDFQIGHFKPYFGMEQNTSSNYIMFLERSTATNALTRDEELGLGFRVTEWDNISLAAGIFNEDGGNNNAADDEAWTADARASADLMGSENVLHVGGGVSYRVPTARTESVTYSARETGVGANLISTGAIANVDHELLYNGEIATIIGPFTLQGEYIHTDVELDAGAAMPDPDFDGWYAQGSWLVTGEMRPYDGTIGNFRRVSPANPFSLKKGGWGAWEILARYENLDLNDRSSGVLGGEIDSWTAGLNWYLTKHVRLMANYISVDTDSNAVVANDDPNIVNVRVQWDF